MKEQDGSSWYTSGEESSTAQNEVQEHAGGGKCPVWAYRAHKKGGTWGPVFLIAEPQPKVGEREGAIEIPVK